MFLILENHCFNKAIVVTTVGKSKSALLPDTHLPLKIEQSAEARSYIE